MLAKMTVKNQLTLPKAVARRFKGVEYFDVSTDGDSITLRPLQRSRLDEVRAKLEQLGQDIRQEDGKPPIRGVCYDNRDLPVVGHSTSAQVPAILICSKHSASPLASP